MSQVAKAYLQDKDIRTLEPINRRYYKVVGAPKELIIFVSPKGKKRFTLKLQVKGDKYIYYPLKEFRAGIYSVAEARKDAIRILGDLNRGKLLPIAKMGADKYKFKSFFAMYIDQKRRIGRSEDYIRRITQAYEKYLLSLADKDVRDIKYTQLLAILNGIYNPNNPYSCRLETISRLIGHLDGTFKIALKDRYIEFIPSFGLLILDQRIIMMAKKDF